MAVMLLPLNPELIIYDSGKDSFHHAMY